MRYGVTGNGILEEAEGMEAFWNQDWKGSVIICPGGGYQWLSPREGEPGGKSLCSPWMEAVDSVLQCGRSGRGSWNRTGEAGGRGCENGSDVGNGKTCISVRFFSRGPCGCQFGSAVE